MELAQSVQRKVLVVDDIAFNRRVLEKILSKQNFDITKASSGEEALMRVEKEIPDLILLDLKCPESMELRSAKGSKRIDASVISPSCS